jgi:hypothetical protein
MIFLKKDKDIVEFVMNVDNDTKKNADEFAELIFKKNMLNELIDIQEKVLQNRNMKSFGFLNYYFDKKKSTKINKHLFKHFKHGAQNLLIHMVKHMKNKK